MQVCVVVSCLYSESVPPVSVKFKGVNSLGGKAEKPVSRGICGDMCLIYTADIEKFLYALVRSLHCLCVIVIIGAFVLIYQNAVFGKGIIAVAVKFAGEKTFSRAKGVGAVNDYKVVAVSFVRTYRRPSSKWRCTLGSSSLQAV